MFLEVKTKDMENDVAMKVAHPFVCINGPIDSIKPRMLFLKWGRDCDTPLELPKIL